MRVLFVTNLERTVLYPMVPLAWALRAAGHEVRVAGQPSLTATVTRAGLTAVPLGRDQGEWWNRGPRAAEVEADRAGLFRPYDVFDDPEKATWDYLWPGMADVVSGTHRAACFPIISELVEYCRRWQPDLIVWEPLAYAGPIAAKACGAAHARILYGVDVFGSVREIFLRVKNEQPSDRQKDPLADWLGGYARKYGDSYTEDMAVGHFTIDQFPRVLQVEAEGLQYERMRYIPYGGPATVPKWLWRPPARRRVALTLGLAATETFGGYALDLQDVLDHLGEMDVEVVATLAESVKEQLDRIPANFRIVSYVPLHALAPTCDAVIHHAGAATLATISRYGVPQLSIPFHFDEPVIARMLAAQGAGLDLPTAEATGASVRANLLRLLDEPVFAERASALAEEFNSLPTPNALVPRLQALAVKHRP